MMRLSDLQISQYHRDGYLVVPQCFSPAELDLLRPEVFTLFAKESPARVLEKTGEVRSVFAPDATSPMFGRLARIERLVVPASQLLDSDVYVHQYKINAKAALGGDLWEWHQDFLYWHKEDGMPAPRVLSAVLFLQDVNQFNGPMLVIPGSHRAGMLDVEADSRVTANAACAWMPTLTADLKYKITKNMLTDLLDTAGMVSVEGHAGFVLFFDGNLFHASSCNLSPHDRVSIFVTYNSVENALTSVPSPRPGFIANRDFTPIVPLPDAELFECGQGSAAR